MTIKYIPKRLHALKISNFNSKPRKTRMCLTVSDLVEILIEFFKLQMFDFAEIKIAFISREEILSVIKILNAF